MMEIVEILDGLCPNCIDEETEEISKEQGPHHLRVEYECHHCNAYIELTVSIPEND